jgi:hypothetical protein
MRATLCSDHRAKNRKEVVMPTRLELVEDEISRKLAEAHASGELKSAKGYGQPLVNPEGWDETPEEFRMGFKALKDAGFYPPEVELMRRRSELRAVLASMSEAPERVMLALELASLDQRISVRLEAVRASGVL